MILSGETENEVMQFNSVGVATNSVRVDNFEQVSFNPVTLLERFLHAG
ncbi:hypothetical protein FB555_000792 [Alpinimonas psychrophila]|uniref:Uncharacterized protein n=1 Tax=Alpinimonas psychrophila TaxID=748908 RepID=A0A7W3PNY5_9MICO|nr:hypothetical protein [Alpinimonas psychrophila]